MFPSWFTGEFCVVFNLLQFLVCLEHTLSLFLSLSILLCEMMEVLWGMKEEEGGGEGTRESSLRKIGAAGRD